MQTTRPRSAVTDQRSQACGTGLAATPFAQQLAPGVLKGDAINLGCGDADRPDVRSGGMTFNRASAPERCEAAFQHQPIAVPGRLQRRVTTNRVPKSASVPTVEPRAAFGVDGGYSDGEGRER